MNIDIASIDMVSEVNMVSIEGLGLVALGGGALAFPDAAEKERCPRARGDPARPPAPKRRREKRAASLGLGWRAAGGRRVAFATPQAHGAGGRRRESKGSNAGHEAGSCGVAPEALPALTAAPRRLPASNGAPCRPRARTAHRCHPAALPLRGARRGPLPRTRPRGRARPT